MNELNSLVGKNIVEVIGERHDDEFILKTDCGLTYTFYHKQDCCEDVYLEDIAGDRNDLLGEIVLAEEIEGNDIDMPFESYTWTYYRLATKKGLVVLRFFGSSNGYYSEKVSIAVKGS